MTDLALHYDFLSPSRIHFGWGRRVEAGGVASSLGQRAFLISGSRTLENQGVIAELHASLREAGVEPAPVATISHEPEVADVDRAADDLRQQHPADGDLVLAIGGGSAIDLGKAVAGLATNREGQSVQDYLEGVGTGLTLTHRPLPLMAMPTTSGAGSEATKNAVISSYDPPFKKSLRSPWLIPQAVLVDPELTVTAPATTTAYTGMDAITQLIESYVSVRAKPIPQALALAGLELAVPAIVDAVRNPTSRQARESMAHAALLSGMALANSGLGLAHGVAAALGVHCRVPHGLACAVMLPAAMRVNRAVREAEFARIAAAMTGKHWPTQSAAADAAVEHIADLCNEVGIPQRLCDLGVTAGQIPDIVLSSRGNSMNGNPRPLSDDELQSLLEGML